MWTRPELKQQAKFCVKRYYWAAVIACIIFLLIQAAAGSNAQPSLEVSKTYQSENGNQYKETYATPYIRDSLEKYFYSWTGLSIFSTMVEGTAVMLAVGIVLLRFILTLFILNPIQVGMARFFYRNRTIKTGVGELAFAFNGKDYLSVVKTMFFRELYVFLWTLALVIPGIIKGYEYRMVDYIIAENPNMPVNQVLELSRKMTKGHKYDMFILDLSFFGWLLLGTLTLGITDIFWTNPYRMATEAELYNVLKTPFIEESSQDDVF